MPTCRALLPFLFVGSLAAQWPGHTALLNWSSDQNQMRLAHFGDAIHAVGVTGGLTPNFVHYARSRDGGRTFPVHDQPLAYIGGPNPLVGGLIGDVVVEGDLVAVAVCIPWGGPYVLHSLDGGDSWQTASRVSPASSVPGATRVLAHAHGTTVSVVWNEVRAAGNTWANVSVDSGATWLPTDLQLDAGALSGGNQSLRLAAAGDQLHVAINRSSTPFTAYHQRSVDGGVTWSSSPSPLGGVAIDHWCCSPDVLVASATTGAPLQVSTDAGISWSSVTVPGVTPLAQIRSIAVRGRTILVAAAQGQTQPTNALLQVSADAGQTWLSQPYSIGLYRNYTIAAHVGGDALFVHFAFQDSAWPPGAVTQSDDGGNSWRLVTGEAARGFLPLDFGGLVLTKTSPSSTDWRAWVAEGHTRHGAGTVGAGGIEPRLYGNDSAGLGRRVTYEVRDAVGGMTALFCWSLGGVGSLVSVPIGASTSYLQSPVTRLAMGSGAPGVPGAGAANASVTIPNNPVFVGWALDAQAFVLDAAVPDGFVATGALQSWIY